MRRARPSQLKRRRRRVYRKARGRCRYCKAAMPLDAATIDHRRPIGRGGTWHPRNLALACVACNEAKGLLDEATFRALRLEPERLAAAIAEAEARHARERRNLARLAAVVEAREIPESTLAAAVALLWLREPSRYGARWQQFGPVIRRGLLALQVARPAP